MSHPLHAGGNPQRSFHGAMLDIAEDRTYARSFSVSERVLNHARRTKLKQMLSKLLWGGSLEPKLDCGLYTNSGIQRAITNAYATMTSLTATATATRN